jgi:hypothetical protein
VRFSPPDTTVTVRSRPDPHEAGGWLLTVEDWGIGMAPDVLAATNALLDDAPELDMSVSQRLGFHVVARLAARHGIHVSLSPTPGSGATALVRLPSSLTTSLPVNRPEPVPVTSRTPVTDRAPVTVAASSGSRPQPRPRRQAVVPAEPLFEAHSDTLSETRAEARPEPPSEARPWELRTWDGWWAPPVTGEDEEAPDTAAVPTTPPQPQPRFAAAQSRTAAPQPHSTAPQPRVVAPPPRTTASQPRTPAPPPHSAAPQPSTTAPQPRAAAPNGAAGQAARTGLRRRVPQTHLVEQLRLDSGPDAPSTQNGGPQAVREAADALTRYQAARATASRDSHR